MGPKTALITGIAGQDGAYLARRLLRKGYRVVGTTRSVPDMGTWRLVELAVLTHVEIVAMDLTDAERVRTVLAAYRPDEIYNLAAQSSVAHSFRRPVQTAQVDAIGPLHLLDAMHTICPQARFYQASSSEMFGRGATAPQTEATPFAPYSPYATAKLFAHWSVVNFRECHGLYCVSGILFNHESPLRAPEYLTRKVTQGLAAYASGRPAPILVGNLDAHRDWGHADEYADAMWRMLQQPAPMDFVVATGQVHSVRRFIELAAGHLGLRLAWVGTGTEERAIDTATGCTVVQVDPRLYRPIDAWMTVGDASRAFKVLGWTPQITLDQLAGEMVRADLDRLSATRFASLS